jgi:Rad52/22 family double-strand break repair protein
MMGFSDQQLRALGRRVPARAVRSRTVSGKELTYIEGWFALSQANRIFGFDGWDRETVETKCLQAREARGTYTAIYAARVRITVRTGDRTIIRDGHGTGEAHGASIGEVHDRALKAAETDATKRALATFGKAFGLALYAGPSRGAQKKTNGTAVASKTPQHVNGGSLPVDGQVESAIPNAEAARAASNNAVPGVSALPLNGTQHVDKTALTLTEPHRIRDKEHLRFVAAQPCLLCSATPADAHHLRFAHPRAMSRKVGDQFTVPLCRAHHRELHHCGNEVAWWHDMGIDALGVADQLWRESVAER